MPGQKQGKSPKIERAGKNRRVVPNPKTVTRHKRKSEPFRPENSMMGAAVQSHVGATKRRIAVAYGRTSSNVVQQAPDQTVESLCNATALRLMEELDAKMVSPSRAAHKALREMFAAFMEAYTTVTCDTLAASGTTRTEYALRAATAEQPYSSLIGHVRKCVRAASSTLEQPQMLAQAG
jgi:hypothetical protein